MIALREIYFICWVFCRWTIALNPDLYSAQHFIKHLSRWILLVDCCFTSNFHQKRDICTWILQSGLKCGPGKPPKSYTVCRIYKYIPRAPMIHIFESHPPKQGLFFPIKTRVIWVLDIYSLFSLRLLDQFHYDSLGIVFSKMRSGSRSKLAFIASIAVYSAPWRWERGTLRCPTTPCAKKNTHAVIDSSWKISTGPGFLSRVRCIGLTIMVRGRREASQLYCHFWIIEMIWFSLD